MDGQSWLLVALLLGVPAVIGLWAWLTAKRGPEATASVRRQGSAALGGGFDEVFHPNAHAARQIWETEVELPAPSHLPGDPGPDLSAGQITIMLPEEETQGEGAHDEQTHEEDAARSGGRGMRIPPPARPSPS